MSSTQQTSQEFRHASIGGLGRSSLPINKPDSDFGSLKRELDKKKSGGVFEKCLEHLCKVNFSHFSVYHAALNYPSLRLRHSFFGDFLRKVCVLYFFTKG